MSKPTTIRIHIPEIGSDECSMVLERGGIATMHTFSMATEGGEDVDGFAIHNAVKAGLLKLLLVEAAPPPDIQVEDPKPAPAPKASAPKKPQTTGTTIKPAATPAPPVAPKWYTNPDTGEVKMDNVNALNESGWFGPFDTKAAADAAVPEWLRSAFKPKKKR